MTTEIQVIGQNRVTFKEKTVWVAKRESDGRIVLYGDKEQFLTCFSHLGKYLFTEVVCITDSHSSTEIWAEIRASDTPRFLPSLKKDESFEIFPGIDVTRL